MHDTVSLLESLFCEPSSPKARLELARPVLYGEGSVFQPFKLAARAQRTTLFRVMQAGAVDGYSVVAAQQGWGLFNPARRVEASQWTFGQFRDKEVLGQIREGLEAVAMHLQAPDFELNIYLLPADPANRALMLRSHGLSVFAGLPGVILIQLWPSEGNLARLGAAITRALVYAGTVGETEVTTLSDVLRLEGRAARLVRERFPTPLEPQLMAFRAPDNWRAALVHAAELCGVETYDDIRANIYGGEGSSIRSVPEARALDEEERVYVKAVLREAGNETQPTRIAAHLYGDEVVAPQGHVGVGVPPFGGVAVTHLHL